MISRQRTGPRSARASRMLARAPRVAVLVAVALLALAGLRGAVAGPQERVPVRRPAPGPDLAAEALAQRFARAYLTVDPDRPERRERALSALTPGSDLGLDSVPGRDALAVRWTTVVADERTGAGRAVTVAAETDSGLVHLAVPVTRDDRGLLAVGGPPALVGGPARATEAPKDRLREPVEDSALQAVAGRVVRNYLAGERRNLAADLAPSAVVSLPGRALDVRSVERTAWRRRGRAVAVDVRAVDPADGARHLLRYELAVGRRAGRWQVTAIGDRPVSNRGGDP